MINRSVIVGDDKSKDNLSVWGTVAHDGGVILRSTANKYRAVPLNLWGKKINSLTRDKASVTYGLAQFILSRFP